MWRVLIIARHFRKVAYLARGMPDAAQGSLAGLARYLDVLRGHAGGALSRQPTNPPVGLFYFLRAVLTRIRTAPFSSLCSCSELPGPIFRTYRPRLTRVLGLHDGVRCQTVMLQFLDII